MTSRHTSFINSTNRKQTMFTTDTLRIKLFGQVTIMTRVLLGGEVVQVCNSAEEAQAWIAAQ
jgi:hypothetical protein